MVLKVKDFMKRMEEIAPARLKESYDQVGLMVGNTEAEIKGILVALDCTLEVIEEAKQKGCNFIFTHHPLLFIKPKTITNETLLGRKIIALLQNDLHVYASHTNLDSAPGGLNDLIMELLGYPTYNIIEPSSVTGYEKNAGVGRIVTLETPILLSELCEKVKKVLGTSKLRYAGEDTMKVQKIAVVNGSGEDFFYASKKAGADCIITGDTRYHHVSDLREEKIALIDAGHFNTEWPTLQRFAKSLTQAFRKERINTPILLSECTQDPYQWK